MAMKMSEPAITVIGPTLNPMPSSSESGPSWLPFLRRTTEAPVKASACWEYTRTAGGYARAMAELSQAHPPDPDVIDRLGDILPETFSLPEGTGFAAFPEVAHLREAAFIHHFQTGEGHGRLQGLPVAKVEAIRERGAKVRVASKSPAALVFLLHFLRRWLFCGLEKEPAVKRTLTGDHRRAAEEALQQGEMRRSQNVLLSSDLTAASDLLPHDLIGAIVEGLLEGAPIPAWAQRVLREGTGRQLLDYGDGSYVTSTRGILMGLPTTWSLLSLVHLFWVDEATFPHPARTVLRRRVTICGDDLLAGWPRSVVDHYERTAKACHAVFSFGKHYWSRDSFVYTEEFGRVVWEKRTVRDRRPLRVWDWVVAAGFAPAEPPVVGRFFSRVIWEEAVPLRGLVRPDVHPHAIGETPTPWWCALGPAVEALGSVERQRAGRRVMKTLYPYAWCWARARNLFPTLPRALGGLSFPNEQGLPYSFGRQTREVREAVWGAVYPIPSGPSLSPAAAFTPEAAPWWALAAESTLATLTQVRVREVPTQQPTRRWRKVALPEVARASARPFSGKGALLGSALEAPTALAVRASMGLLGELGPPPAESGVPGKLRGVSATRVARETRAFLRAARRRSLAAARGGASTNTREPPRIQHNPSWKQLLRKRKEHLGARQWWAPPVGGRTPTLVRDLPVSDQVGLSLVLRWGVADLSQGRLLTGSLLREQGPDGFPPGSQELPLSTRSPSAQLRRWWEGPRRNRPVWTPWAVFLLDRWRRRWSLPTNWSLAHL
eukprot:TRINITY_DN204_c0_g1_i4.p1 TRINITY_DN204_c0_g1~~TRINITY_DN204_c0_g1_i4.p1  ORF type:complete len:776 (-),score=-34.45 TRINITY_DN204_c0_g1_i4:14-2341(-)